MAPDDLRDADLDDAADTGPEDRAPERMCVLTRAKAPRDALLRLVAGPDGAVLADVGARAPGRGAWVTPDRALLADAIAKRRLGAALARAWKCKPPAVGEALLEQVDAALARRLLDRLGLEHRGGRLIFGSDKIGERLRAGRVHLLLHAEDAADDGTGKLEQAARVGERAPGIVLPIGRARLSAAVGRDNSVHLGITDAGAAARVRADAMRLMAWMGRTEQQTDFGQGARAPRHEGME
jgi:predicted RNA-binding protein YlxR (DUF448 family)